MQRKDHIVDLIFHIGLRNGISIDRLVEYCSYLSGEVEPVGFNTTVLNQKSDMSSYEIALKLYKVQFSNDSVPKWYQDYQITAPPSR